MNVAHVSGDLVCKLCQHGGDGGSTALESSKGISYALLRLDLDSPSDDAKEVVCTPLCLIPKVLDDNMMANQPSIDRHHTVETICINPLLLRVLRRSSTLANRCNDANDSNKVNNKQEDGSVGGVGVNQSAASSQCQVRLMGYNGQMHGTTTGWLEPLNVKDGNEISISNNTEQPNATTIHLTYICSNSSRCRGYFNNKNSVNTELRRKGMDLLMTTLAGEVVVEGGILCVDFAKKDSVFNIASEMYCDIMYEKNEELVFFMVGKIISASSDESTCEAGSAANCLCLGPRGTFDISFEQPGENKIIPQLSQSTKVQSSVQVDDVQYNCQGYEDVLEELLTLAKMNDPNGAPTAVMLSGCSGVGKSRMVRMFFRLWISLCFDGKYVLHGTN